MSNADTLSPQEAVAQAKAAAGFLSFTLTDHAGEAHRYEVRPHGLDGAEWCIELAAVTGGAIARLAQGKLTVLVETFMLSDGKGVDALKEVDVEALLAKLDGEGELNLTGATNDVIRIMRAIGPEGCASLFRYTKRDNLGLDVRTQEGRANYDDFVRANWGEWRDAAVKIFEVNRFADFLGFGSGSESEEAEESPAEKSERRTG